MADIRAKAVLNALADLYDKGASISSLMTNLRPVMGYGDSIDIPSIGSLTVASAIDGSLDPQDVTVQSVTNSALTLTANVERAIFLNLPALGQLQNINGNWASLLGSQVVQQLRNDTDSLLAQYLGKTLCYDTSATYHHNVAGDSFALADFLNAKAYLQAQGALPQNLVFVVHPYAEASIHALSAFQSNWQRNMDGDLGMPMIGMLFGIPVYVSSSLQTYPTTACTAVSVSSNVATVTVGSGHGLVPGLKIKITGITTELTTAAAITSVGATSVVVPLTAGDGAMDDGAGTITEQSAWNLLFDKTHMFYADQKAIGTRVVADPDSTSDVLQCSSIWGRIGRAGRCVVIHTPPASA